MVKKSSTHQRAMGTDADIHAQVKKLQTELVAAQEAKLRALADYQNLIRRQQDDRAAFVKFACSQLVADLLQPLDHLDLASRQLNDPGLTMVVDQLWQRLREHGLEKLEVMGQPLDVNKMEVVDTKQSAEPRIERQETSDPGDEPKLVVVEVRRPGYSLNSEVVQPTQVVMGQPVKSEESTPVK